jgi:hypothetical protein
MTAKDKAIDLYHKYYTTLLPNVRMRKGIAIQHALIAVEEIEKSIDFDCMEVQNLDRQHAYWEQVKTELNKL